MLKVPEEEVTKLVSKSFQSFKETYSDFNKFSFIPRIIPVCDSPAAMFSMFCDLGMVTR